ncbi:MAG: trehalase family glycosidase [Planctomycetota bacterium]
MPATSKIALGGGGFCLYAPRFPRHLLSPGFADPCHVADVELPRMFVVTILHDGDELPLTATKHEFKNGVLTVEYATDIRGVKVREERYITTDDRFVSNITLDNSTKAEREMAIVLWTTTDPEGEAPIFDGDSFKLRRQLKTGDRPAVPTEIVFGSPDSKGARCLQGYFAEGDSGDPVWGETPWFDRSDLTPPRAKKPMVKPSPIIDTARVYLGVFRKCPMKAGETVTHRQEANVLFKGKGITHRPRRPDPKDENGYSAFYDKVPRFTCEDKRLERIVAHRFEAMYLLRTPGGAGNLGSPTICRANTGEHVPMASSAAAAIREARWLQDPALARGILKSFFENVKQNGMVPNRLHMAGLQGVDYEHADWGGAFEALDDIHSDRATKRAVVMEMQRYSKWLDNNRDPEGSGLTDIVNVFECGHRFSRRFSVLEDKLDKADDAPEEAFRIKGVDASVYRYRLVKFLAFVADELQEKAMQNRFIAATENIKAAIAKRLWDEKSGMFIDVDPRTRRKTGVKSAIGFLPLGTDIPNQKQIDAMIDVLGKKDEFWTPYPVPTVSVSDPSYDPLGQWKGTRRHEAWNGRTHMSINSQLMDSLAYVAERGHKKGRKLLKQLFEKTVSMCSGELEGHENASVHAHYHPETGRPSRYDGVDWSTGAFLMDNIFRVAGGFVVRFGEVQDDPVIDDMPDFKLHGVPIGNRRFNVERKNGKLKVNPD